jgi:hypothetical protein
LREFHYATLIYVWSLKEKEEPVQAGGNTPHIN